MALLLLALHHEALIAGSGVGTTVTATPSSALMPASTVGRRSLLAAAAAVSTANMFTVPAHAETPEEAEAARAAAVQAKLQARMARSGVKTKIDTSNVKVLELKVDALNSAEMNEAIEKYKNAPSFTERWSTALDSAKK